MKAAGSVYVCIVIDRDFQCGNGGREEKGGSAKEKGEEEEEEEEAQKASLYQVPQPVC